MDNRGSWTTEEEFATHVFDGELCNIIIATFPVSTAVDIGCGRGDYVMALREAGIACWGFDGSPSTGELSGGVCETMDFSEPRDIGQFDLVLCLEVGEHVPVGYEQTFIDNICKASREYVCLSWAVAGQGGTGHVNCRNNGYIINEMQKRGFEIDWEHTEYLRERSTLPWFKESLMVFNKQ